MLKNQIQSLKFLKKISNHIIMSKLYYRLNSLCTVLKQEKLIDDYDISHLKIEIDEKKLFDKKHHWSRIFIKTFNCGILVNSPAESLN